MLAGDIKRTWADVSTTFAAHGLFLSPPTHGVHQSQTAIPPATKQGAIARAIPVTEVPPLVFSTYQLLLLGHAAADRMQRYDTAAVSTLSPVVSAPRRGAEPVHVWINSGAHVGLHGELLPLEPPRGGAR